MTDQLFTGGDVANERRLLLVLAEELKLPIVQAQQQTELYENKLVNSFDELRRQLGHAIWLIDAYLLNETLAQQQLVLSPVSVSSVLYDVAHELSRTAKQYGCELQLHIEGKHLPVMADRNVLQTAFVGVASTLIEAADQKQIVTLTAHKTKSGITIGVFSDNNTLSDQLFARAKSLYGQTRQPLNSFTAQPGAGIFIADNLLQQINSALTVSQHNNQKGLTATLLPSRQLALV